MGLPCLTQPVFSAGGPDATVVIELPDSFDINDARPMGLSDVASVFPFAGPFGSSADGVPGDRFLHETLDEVDRGFLNQLLPVMQARWPTEAHPCDNDVRRLCPHADDPLHCLGLKAKQLSKPCTAEIRHTVPYLCSREIHDLCDDGLDQGALACLEKHGGKLDPTCADAVVAVKHALSSLAATRKEAADKLKGKAKPKKAKHAKKGKPACPSSWEESSGSDSCCTRRWSPTCGASCSAAGCNGAPGGHNGAGWEFKWVDFRSHPYICCPRPAPSKKHIGGQPICPTGWTLDHEKMHFCCRRAWTWACGQHCAEEQCARSEGMKWIPVDYQHEHYACCPDGYEPDQHRAPPSSKAATGLDRAGDAIPNAPGASWVSKPLDLAAGGWTSVGLLVGVVILLVLAVRWLLPMAQGGARHGAKDL